MHMKILHRSIFGFALILALLPALRAQDLSTYRSFAIGTTLPVLLKQTGQDLSAVKALHEHPALIQELTLWPSATAANARRPDAVERIQFSFYNGGLYKIHVVYDQRAVEGLTEEDMLHLISAPYGPPTNLGLKVDPASNARYEMKDKLIASWEDSQFSIQLLSNSVAGSFALLLLSKYANKQAEAAIVEAAKLEDQERPRKEADQRKKEAADLELVRQKNKKSFQP
jgi:hypothetical protein